MTPSLKLPVFTTQSGKPPGFFVQKWYKNFPPFPTAEKPAGKAHEYWKYVDYCVSTYSGWPKEARP